MYNSEDGGKQAIVIHFCPSYKNTFFWNSPEVYGKATLINTYFATESSYQYGKETYAIGSQHQGLAYGPKRNRKATVSHKQCLHYRATSHRAVTFTTHMDTTK